MKKILLKAGFTLLVLLPLLLEAQDNMPIILKAMYDEQQRSMNELRLEGHEAPFYISYDIDDVKTYFFSATSGALVQSGSRSLRSKNTRILVGGYEFNDESLDNNIFTNPQPNEIAMPLEDDYEGIRRSLWVTTDAIYRSAAQHFKENQNTLKEKGKELKDLPHRTFAKVIPQQVNQYKTFASIDVSHYEKYVRKLSEYFLAIPEIYTSTVSLNIIQGNRYYLNSEGTSSITPISTVMLEIRADRDHNWQNSKEITRFYPATEKLPSIELLTDELKIFTKSVLQQEKDSLKLEEEYAGPVLFTGEAVSEVLASLFFGRESLQANNNLEVDNRMRFENTSSLENRVGKLIVNEAITVIAKPRLKTFQGMELMGAFEIDSEGVSPPDELILVEKGVLKNLLNDRSLTKSDQTTNGHANGPGVIEVTFNGTQTEQTLKQLLLSKAKADGLAYAYLVKKIATRAIGETEVYRVEVATGKEERIADAHPSALQLKNLRKSKASSNKLNAFNMPLGGNEIASLICPEALLLEDIEITPGRMKVPEDEETIFVEAPKE